jgi:hypothetical protein
MELLRAPTIPFQPGDDTSSLPEASGNEAEDTSHDERNVSGRLENTTTLSDTDQQSSVSSALRDNLVIRTDLASISWRYHLTGIRYARQLADIFPTPFPPTS